MGNYSIKEYISGSIKNAYFIDGFDDCLIGIAKSGREEEYVPCYSLTMMIHNIMNKYRINNSKAVKFLSENFLDVNLGNNGPIFFEDYDDDKIKFDKKSLDELLDHIGEHAYEKGIQDIIDKIINKIPYDDASKWIDSKRYDLLDELLNE
jgi:hypothetical protein